MADYSIVFGRKIGNYQIDKDGTRMDSLDVTDALYERDSLQAQLEAMKAQNARLRAVIGLDIDWPEVTKVLDETPKQSLAEIEARAIESAVDECAWYGDRVWMKIDEVKEYAARLRQQGETP